MDILILGGAGQVGTELQALRFIDCKQLPAGGEPFTKIKPAH